MGRTGGIYWEDLIQKRGIIEKYGKYWSHTHSAHELAVSYSGLYTNVRVSMCVCVGGKQANSIEAFLKETYSTNHSNN